MDGVIAKHHGQRVPPVIHGSITSTHPHPSNPICGVMSQDAMHSEARFCDLPSYTEETTWLSNLTECLLQFQGSLNL